MTGIIYKYTSPVGKVYIGQTLNEKRRKNEFLDLNVRYAGSRIENARKKYGPENFQYEILEEKTYTEINEALLDLNFLEGYYIGLYNSLENGYNMTNGGETLRGFVYNDDVKKRISETLKEHFKKHDNPFKGKKHTEETKNHLRNIAKERHYAPFKGKKWSNEDKKRLSELAKARTGEKNPFWGKKHTEKTKKTIGESNSIAVVQIDITTNKVIKKYNSAKEAGDSLGKPRGNSEIIKVCKKYVSPSGRRYLTAYGYKWEYENNIEGSTTIEKTPNSGTE